MIIYASVATVATVIVAIKAYIKRRAILMKNVFLLRDDSWKSNIIFHLTFFEIIIYFGILIIFLGWIGSLL